MFSYQVYEYYKAMSTIMYEFEKGCENLFYSSECYERKREEIISSLVRPRQNNNTKSTEDLTSEESPISELESLIEHFRMDFDFVEFIGNATRFKNDMDKIMHENAFDDKLIIRLINKLNTVMNCYHQYLRTWDFDIAFVFYRRLNSFIECFETTSCACQSGVGIFTIHNQETTELYPKSQIEIQMLDMDYTFEQFVHCLNSISVIYESLRIAMYNEKASVELKIAKIESGSLFAKLFGEQNILEAINLLLTRTIELAFSRFTHEGKLERISNLRKELINMGDTASQLKALGYDISSSDEIIENTFARATKQLEDLALSAPRFKINGVSLSISESIRKKYIEAAQTKLIPDKRDNAVEMDNENEDTE